MKKLLLLPILLLTAGALFAQTTVGEGEGTLSKKWSRIASDLKTIPVNPDPTFVYTPVVPQVRRVSLKSIDATVNPNVRVHPTTNSTQSELSIDIHPTNSNIIFCSGNTTDWSGGSVINLYGTGQYWTLDGGLTWGGTDVPPQGANSGDPVSLISGTGMFIEGFISGSENEGGQGIATSTNNGTTWTRYNAGPAPASTSDLLDKNHAAVDKSPASPYYGRIYDAWTCFVTGSTMENQIELKWSSNNGQTWSASKNLSGALNAGSHNQGVNVQVGPNGLVYVTWALYQEWASGSYGEDAIGFAKSTDGGETWSTPIKAYSAANFGIRGNLKTASIRVSSFPSMAVDRTGGAKNGYIYITWPQKGVAPAGSDPDIVMIKSSDNGATWSTPVRVNDDAMNNARDQYYPWCTVDQSTGALYLVWYDSRNGSTNDSAEVYMARTLDGTTFENIKVSDQRFKPATISGLASGYQGDYIGIAAANNTAWPFWSENRSGAYQAWTAKVTFGPKINHTALRNTELLAGPYPVSATITSPSGITSAKVFWGRGTNGEITDSVALTATGDVFNGNIPGNGSAATYNYYIKAVDGSGAISYFPAGAPSSKLSFVVATDNVAPIVVSTPLPNQFRETWPPQVIATATDNIGIDSVYAVYKLNNGTLRRSNLVLQTDGTWKGPLTLDTALTVVGDSVLYRVVARDASTAHNLGYTPSSTGWNVIKLVADLVAPVINHTPLRNVPRLRWPATVAAAVTDTLGLQSVTCQYSAKNGVLTGSFVMNLVDGQYKGVFPIDTAQLHAGDTVKYKIKAIDASNNHNISYSPASGMNQFAIINVLGVVLVVNDDVTLKDRSSGEKSGLGDDKSILGASSTLIASTLLQEGFAVDTVSFANMDTTLLHNYDIVALSAGTRTTQMFADAGKRTAVVNYTLNGGKTFVEGGEVGYQYRSTTGEKDALFRTNVLNCSTWVSDVSSGNNWVKKNIPTHAIFTAPYLIPDSLQLTGTGYGPRDAMRIIPDRVGTYKVGTWWNYPDTAGIIAYSPTNNNQNIRNVFCTFAVGTLSNTTAAAHLITNIFSALAGGSGNVPVELTSFTASANDNGVRLNWSTATEVNNSGFSIERKSNSEKSFSSIAFVTGKGTTTDIHNYSFVDNTVGTGSYTYRLKQVDFDGTSSYSSEVSVDLGTVTRFALEQNYPNPFNPSTVIRFSVPVEGMVKLSVYNVLGEFVTSLVNSVQKAGTHEVRFDASKLSSGVYLYRLDANGSVSIKKMILTK